MKWLFKKAIALVSVYYAHMLEYRAEIFLWALSSSFTIILMGIWVQASQQGDFNLDSIQFARYFFSVFLVRQFTNVWVIWDFEKDVIQGRLSFRLLQPLDPVWYHVVGHFSEKLVRIPLVIALTGLFFGLYPQAFWLPSLSRAFLAILATATAFSLSFLIQYTFSMLAFWTERANAIQQLWFLFYIFLSGMFAPLEVFPPLLREILLWTPLPYLVYFPATLLVGLPIRIIPSGLIILAWAIVFFVLNRWLWRRGLKQYSGMGA